MTLAAGTQLGPYEVLSLIGSGGMGEVYRAKDTKLGRDVALKVLPELFADDPERLARFQREAKVLASLNHPNIASIYGLEETGDAKALVLELVEGPTLADRIAQGAIPVDEALPIARQIAEALEAAHEAGVIHRDLKPANVKVKPDGLVKVLDFGLAKALEPEVGGDPSESPTMTAAVTRAGVIMGTPAYMSPEQARGKTVDKRADIWAFGAVLFEMLAGERAFPGKEVSDTLAYVLTKDADWTALPKHAPASLKRLLRRCLARDPKLRLRDIGDARIELTDASTTPASRTSTTVAPALRIWQQPMFVVLAVALAAGLSALAVWNLVRPITGPRVRSVISTGADTLFIASASRDVAISPDGRRVAYSTLVAGAQQLQMRPLDQLAATTLVAEGQPFQPFFSPDGAWLGFFDLGDGVLKKVSVAGGPTQDICDLPGGALRGATWGDDDTIVFATLVPGSGLWRVDAGGGEPEPLTTPDQQGDHMWPQVLLGAQAVLFTVMPQGGADSAQIAVFSSESGETKTLIDEASDARYVPTGHLVYGRAGALWAVVFDADRLEVASDPMLVQPGVMTKASGAANFVISDDGSLVYVPGAAGGSGRTLA